MTDKQIIIDGVDVSGCEWISEVGLDSEYICNCNSPNKTSGYCKYNPNCCYKQLKRKEQECDMWKNLTVDNGAVALKYQQQLDQLKQTLTEIKEIAGNVQSFVDSRLEDDVFTEMDKILQKCNEVLDEDDTTPKEHWLFKEDEEE